MTKPPDTSTSCPACKGMNWVCEEHENHPWYGAREGEVGYCCGGAGMPCLKCNPSDYDNPPRDMPGFKIIYDKDGFHPHIVGGTDDE